MQDCWFDEELLDCRLGDGRLDSRLRQLVALMDAGFGESIPVFRRAYSTPIGVLTH